MEEATGARYWCHMCSETVSPIIEVEIKCPLCQSGFVEEMSSSMRDNQEFEFGSDRALSRWAPIFLGMMGSSRRRRRLGRVGFEEEDDDNIDGQTRYGGEFDLDHHLESILRRRRRNSATILQLLQGIRAGMASEFENPEGDRDRERDRDGNRERVILINPYQTIIVPGSHDSSNGQNQNQTPIASLGDYFIGPGLDLLLQHLAENDPNRYGTPPAQKEAVEALPAVTINETLQCSVCLDDFKIGTEAKEMPCKHKFHSGCILPWLELHSSCPVCRFRLPADESKLDSERSTSTSNHTERDDGNRTPSNRNSTEEGDGEGRNGGGRRFFSWAFNGLFSTSSSHSGRSNSTTTSSANASGNASQTEEN